MTLRLFFNHRGGQSGTLTFFRNRLLTGQHLANSGGGELKKTPCIILRWDNIAWIYANIVLGNFTQKSCVILTRVRRKSFEEFAFFFVREVHLVSTSCCQPVASSPLQLSNFPEIFSLGVKQYFLTRQFVYLFSDTVFLPWLENYKVA